MAFLQPYAPRQPIFRAPASVLWLIVALVAAHAVRIALPGETSQALVMRFAFIPARYSTAFLASHGLSADALWQRVVPFFSYVALHNDFIHVAINSVWLLAFGPIVARRFGTTLFLLFFALCGAAGAATYLAFNWGSPMPVIGASAAVSGLMAAGLRLLPTLQPQGSAGAPALAPILSRSFLLFALIWVGMNIVAGLTGIGLGGEAGLVAWQAHLGGFVAGMLLTGPFDRLAPHPVGLPLDDSHLS